MLTKDDIDLAEQIKEFFQELREDGYNQYMLYPLDEIEKAALRGEFIERSIQSGADDEAIVDALRHPWAPDGPSPDALEGADDHSVSTPQREEEPYKTIREIERLAATIGVKFIPDPEKIAAWKPSPQPDQFPDAGKMVDLSGKITPESGELLKIAEQFRAMNPPWFKAISDAAAEIERQNAENQINFERLCAAKDEIAKLREALRAICIHYDTDRLAKNIARTALQKDEGG